MHSMVPEHRLDTNKVKKDLLNRLEPEYYSEQGTGFAHS